MVNEASVPERFEQNIAEAYRHKVLDRLLAEIVIYPIDLPFAEKLRQGTVQITGAIEIMTEGLFDDDTAVPARNPVAVQAFGQRDVDIGTHREIERPNRVLP